MKISMLAFFVALIASTANAQYSNNNRDQVISRSDDPTVYSDNGGEYHIQTIEKRVWVPEYQTQGVLGIGKRTVSGHYEMRTNRVKVYNNRQYSKSGQYGQKQPGWAGKHPHGMPPGQRKKLESKDNNYGYPGNYHSSSGYGDGNKGKNKKNKGNNNRYDD